MLYIRVVDESPVLFCAFVTRSTQHIGSAAADTNPSSLCDWSPPATGADCHTADGVLRSVVKQGTAKLSEGGFCVLCCFQGKCVHLFVLGLFNL